MSNQANMEMRNEANRFTPGRQERIEMARRAFGKESVRVLEEQERSGHSGRLFRWVTAGMLFAVFVALYYFDLSIGPVNRESIQKFLADNSLWQQAEMAVAHCVNYFRID